MILKGLLVGVFIFLITALASVTAYRSQEIQFFSDTNFTKKLESFYTTESDLQTLSTVWKNAKSHCVIRGLWRISGTFNFNPNLTFVEIANGIDKAGRVCGSWNSKNQTAQYKSIRLVGSQDLDTPGISFNVKTRFDAEELYFDGNFLRLPKAMTFKSFGFTGKSNWTVYANTDFSGKTECLVAKIDKIKGFAVTFSTNRTLTVGSVWRGCGGYARAITETASPPKKSKSQQSEKSASFHFTVASFDFIVIVSSGIFFLVANL